MVLIDCTLRDGGYYNNWDFDYQLVVDYLQAMDAIGIDYVEMGFRSFNTTGFHGPYFYTTDTFLKQLLIPLNLEVGIMVNAVELLEYPAGLLNAVTLMFAPASQSPVSLVRFACHLHEVEHILPACKFIKELGYKVGLNLMQAADKTDQELENIALICSSYPLDVLYFADSMGSMNPKKTLKIIKSLRTQWQGPIGIHAHDNMGLAVANTIEAVDAGVTWVDSTVSGMGRGPGNAQTEYLTLESEKIMGGKEINLAPLLTLIRKYFLPMQATYGWGKNAFYYMAGQHGIHPSYIQEMLGDTRFDEAEILSAIEHLSQIGGKKFSKLTVEAELQNIGDSFSGSWSPAPIIEGRDVLILGAGMGVARHKMGIESYIQKRKPFVIALNTQASIDQNLIDIRAACHPFRLFADSKKYRSLPQPLVAPLLNLKSSTIQELDKVELFNFGLSVKKGFFIFNEYSAVIPSALVIAYALAISTTGRAGRILLAGFDGYDLDDPRFKEMSELFDVYKESEDSRPLLAITPTKYKVETSSVYSML